MDKKTFQNPYVAAYVSEHYYAVKFNAEGEETINYYDNSFPSPFVALVSSRFDIHQSHEGEKTEDDSSPSS